MEITAEIVRGITYKAFLTKKLRKIELTEFDINQAPASCLVADRQNTFALSWWRSPKRSRSYPYERVYNTLSTSRRITIIPVVKDEGADGDRDFVQWDTIALMSLLDVYVILAFYTKAEKSSRYANKITKQKLDNIEIIRQIREIGSYFSSALHWNLKELNELPKILRKAQQSYQQISAQTGVKMHGDRGLENFALEVEKGLSDFMASSRQKALDAQRREFSTLQPKELLSTATKAKITITNFLGGMYFFTVDEIYLSDGIVNLIECKHSVKAKLPSLSDIKDGLLKMMLYSNLENVAVAGVSVKHKAILQLTSNNLTGNISSNSAKSDRQHFYKFNKFAAKQIVLLRLLFIEARKNKFTVRVGSENQ